VTRDPITSSTAAQILRIPESTVRWHAERGRLPYSRMPSGIRISERRDVERLARELAREREAREVRRV
jgi:DNA-binding transcriptional MerR regulator